MPKEEVKMGVNCRRCGANCKVVYELDKVLFCSNCVIKELEEKDG